MNILAAEKNRRIVRSVLCAAVVLCVVILRFYAANFTKALATYPDELRYYGIARSLFYGDGIRIRNVASSFHKIAYSILLMPFFAIKNGGVRVAAMAFLNVVLMTASLIPLHGILKELRLKPSFRIMLMGVALLFPDMCYSMIFMSEVLYWPLFFCYVLAWMKMLERGRLSVACVAGLLCYLCYLCKEISLALMLASVCFVLCYPVLAWLCEGRRSSVPLRSYFRPRLFACTAVNVLSFCAAYLIFAITVFKGGEGSYAQIGMLKLSAILSPYAFLYLLYGFFSFCIAAFLGLYFFPVLYPVLGFSQLSERARRLFVFCIFFLLIAAATIAYTITVREDFGRTVPRVLFRYVSPVFMLFYAVFMTLFQQGDAQNKSLRSKTTWPVIGMALLAFWFVCKGMPNSTTDHLSLGWYDFLQRKIGSVSTGAASSQSFRLYALVLNSLLCAAVIFLHGIYQKSRRRMLSLFWLCVIALSLADNAIAFRRIRHTYAVPETLVADCEALEQFMARQGRQTLFVMNASDPYGKVDEVFDTYYDSIGRSRVVLDSDVRHVTERTAVSSLELYEPELRYLDTRYEPVSSLDYIIMDSGSDLEPQDARVLPELSGRYYTVYRNEHPNYLSFTQRRHREYYFEMPAYMATRQVYDRNGIRYIMPHGSSFGPCWAVGAGTWRLVLNGRNLSDADCVAYSARRTVRHPIHMEADDSGLTVYLSLDTAVSDFELVLTNTADSTMEVWSLSIEAQ